MATLVLAAAGSAIGASFGTGTVLGLTGAVIGRAVGATLGQVIDQRLFASGSEPVRTGQIDRFRMMGASEGTAIPRIWGRARVGGQVIWASRFREDVVTRDEGGGGGKGAPRRAQVEEYNYSVSLAVALCEGPILRVGRVWADGIEIDPDDYSMHVYKGDEAQLPDPKIAAVEGADRAPAYRGIAYVVFEDLPLAPFGNRVPQFSFEVVRGAKVANAPGGVTLGSLLSAVALIPGTGEYSLATEVVRVPQGPGRQHEINRNTIGRKSDFEVSLRQLRGEMPQLSSVSLVVSWFGDDLRCSHCRVRPKVEQAALEEVSQVWRAGGLIRAEAEVLALLNGRPVYGGTPSDASVMQAIQALRGGGQDVMFYPFVLMEQAPGNALPDPYSDAQTQAVLPWRGRITLSKAPGRVGSPDRTATAAAEVAAFFGSATVEQVVPVDGEVHHFGVTDWGYRRFILHYARLCQLAGGVNSFCIGSELRGVTQIRGAGDSFPAVDALRALAADVRAILGPATKITYAADWSEYWGYVANGNRYFHLDALWADPNIDLIGIDNYMPIADWRDGENHADAAAGSIYDLDYLNSNICGGEGFDWYYNGAEGEASQHRLPIRDAALGEDWIYRYKDLRSWWSLPHHDRINGVRSGATAWVPQSKPFWFTEFGCAALDKAANQPNLFLDPKSSESGLARASNGRRDDLMQMQYLCAILQYWMNPAHNPVSAIYGGPMVDMARAHVWAFDARPFPAFPGRPDLWSDGENYDRGHWLNGRSSAVPLSEVVREILWHSGVTDVDLSRLYGAVLGYVDASADTARSALQPLMMAYGFDCHEREGRLHFVTRRINAAVTLDPEQFVRRSEGDLEISRANGADLPRELRLTHVEAEADYQVTVGAAALPNAGEATAHVNASELPLVLTPSAARDIAEGALTAAHVAQDSVRFALPYSGLDMRVGAVVRLKGQTWRIDRVECADAIGIEAVRVEAAAASFQGARLSRRLPTPVVAESAVFPVFLDLPLLTGEEVPHAPHVAVAAEPWPGRVAVWSAPGTDGFALNTLLSVPAVIGRMESSLGMGRSGLIDHAARFMVRLGAGSLASCSMEALLNGENLAAIGDGAVGNWEVIQFLNAVPVAPDVWEISGCLRAQCGTDAALPPVWPAGCLFVLLNPAVRQISLRESEVGLPRTFRIGRLARGYADTRAVQRIDAFWAIGRRPYRVAHLRRSDVGSTHRFGWIRRTRLDGDGWRNVEVPLGEGVEAYRLIVSVAGLAVRQVDLAMAEFEYTAQMRAADGVTGAYSLEVAQLSESFGPGPFRRIDLPG
jgi:hypothetical protein